MYTWGGPDRTGRRRFRSREAQPFVCGRMREKKFSFSEPPIDSADGNRVQKKLRIDEPNRHIIIIVIIIRELGRERMTGGGGGISLAALADHLSLCRRRRRRRRYRSAVTSHGQHVARCRRV